MTSFISHTSVDCADAYALSEWWKPVLGYVDLEDDPNEPGHEECLIRDPETGHLVLFIEVPETKSVKNRIHFDLMPREGTRDEELARLLAHGAVEVHDRAADGDRALGGWSWPTRKATSSASCGLTPSGRPRQALDRSNMSGLLTPVTSAATSRATTTPADRDNFTFTPSKDGPVALSGPAAHGGHRDVREGQHRT